MDTIKRKKVAVIGSGISGIVSSFLLQERYEVTLFEKNDYIGGHTNTRIIPSGPDKGVGIDTGFIVFNDRTYPLLNRFFDRLKIMGQNTEMSFGYLDPATNFCYSSTFFNGIFAQRRNMLKPSFLRTMNDIIQFNRQAKKDLEANNSTLNTMTLREYIEQGKYGPGFKEWYLIPMSAAIWSAPFEKILDFPCESFLRFFNNHGLLDVSHQPQWKTVQGGSSRYVQVFLESFTGAVKKSCNVTGIIRNAQGAVLTTSQGEQFSFDIVVVAVHADQALAMLDDPDETEKRLLGAWRYSKNRVILHTEESIMPENKRAWASWNYRKSSDTTTRQAVRVTYDMNRLQRLSTTYHYLVSLNTDYPVYDDKIFYECIYEHPQFDFASFSTQKELPSLNGKRNTFYCGSYHGHGFHEDGTRSAVAVAEKLGVNL